MTAPNVLPLVVVDLESLTMPSFGEMLCNSIHQDTAPERPLRVVGPDQPLGDAAGIIVTGSDKMLGEDTPWAEGLGQRLEAAATAGTPILGICFGHQLLCTHFGGRLERWPAKKEGVATVEFSTDGPFAGLDRATLFLTHKDHVEDAGELEIVASGGLGGIQATRHPRLPLWTIQAHPESRTRFLDYLPAAIRAEVPDQVIPLLDTPDGKRILLQFGGLLTDSQRS